MKSLQGIFTGAPFHHPSESLDQGARISFNGSGDLLVGVI